MSATIQIDGMEELQRALKAAPQEINRAARNALNDTARNVQRDFRATLHTKFDVRKKTFIERQVYFGREDQATKEKLQARLQMKGPAGQASTLEKFERDKQKKARDGRLAIPVRGIRTGGGHVQPALAWNKLTPLTEMQGKYTKLRKTKNGYRKVKELTSKKQLVGQRGTFMVTLRRSGLDALVRRQKVGRGIDVLYVLKPIVSIREQLQFVQDTSRMANMLLPGHTVKAVEHALRRAGLVS